MTTTLSPRHLDRELLLDDLEPDRQGRHVQRLLARIPMPDAVAVGAVGLAAAVLAFTNLAGAPAYQDDEGIYAAQAIAVQNGELAPYTYWYDHPPFGWIQLAVLGLLPRALEVGDGSGIAAMRAVIGLFFIANAVLIYLIGRRLKVALPFAVLGSAVFMLSPLSLELGRQVYLDTVGMPWLLLAFYLALSPRAALWHHAGAGGAFAIAVLSKITASIFGPALLVAMIDRPAWRGRGFSIVAFLTVGGLLLAFFPILAILRGELLPGDDHVSLLGGLFYQFGSREGSGYLWEAGSGRSQLVAGWMNVDGFIVIAGAIAALVCLASRRTRWILVAIASFFVPVLLGQGYLPAMYIVGGLPFLCLAIAAGSDLFWHGSLRLATRVMPAARRTAPVVTALVLAVVLLPIPFERWVDRDTQLLSADVNADWRASRDWVEQNVSRDDVVLVPFSLWQELDDAGWDGPWAVVALEKADLDTDFAVQHPGGWREIDWIVEGPSVEPTIRYLGLEAAATAYANSTIVASFGDWHIRRVDATVSAPE